MIVLRTIRMKVMSSSVTISYQSIWQSFHRPLDSVEQERLAPDQLVGFVEWKWYADQYYTSCRGAERAEAWRGIQTDNRANIARVTTVQKKISNRVLVSPATST